MYGGCHFCGNCILNIASLPNVQSDANQNLSKLHFSISEYAGLEATQVFFFCFFFKSANQVETHLTVMRGPYGPPDSTQKGGGVELSCSSSLFTSGKCRPLMTKA